MHRLVSIVCLCAACVTSVQGREPAADAKKKLVQQIDSFLKVATTQRAVIEEALVKMQEALDKLVQAQVKSRTDADVLAKQIKISKTRLEEAKSVLVRLRTDLEKMKADPTYTVTYGGKTYAKAEDLGRLLEKVVDYHKMLADDTAAMEKLSEKLEQTATLLAARADEAKKKHEEIRKNLLVLDLKLTLVKTQRETVEALKENDKDLADKIKRIEEQLKELDK